MNRLRYYFEQITACEMCGVSSDAHVVMGQRLNQSQGMSPRGKSGITVSVKKCGNCGLIYSSPQPVPFDLQDHYGAPPESYWTPGYFEWNADYFAEQIKTAKHLLPFRAGMRALDIGAGIGKCMLSLESAGFEAHGFEPSESFYRRALSEMKISHGKLRLGKIEELSYDKGSFDLITFGAVFEHLYHPAASLERALSWLKPGGIIHIEVPSSRYLMAKVINLYFRLCGTNYVTNISPMHPPFHLYEFGYKSFEELARRLGCTIAHHVYDVGSIPFAPVFLHPLLRGCMKLTRSGMQLTVYLRKSRSTPI